MLSQNFARFLRSLSLDPALLEAFEADPQRVLRGAGLTPDEVLLLERGGREILRRNLAADIKACPSC
jgi:hypothetical protein